MAKASKHRTVTGGNWKYLAPFLQGPKWRVRRKHLLTGKTECLTIEGVRGLKEFWKEALDARDLLAKRAETEIDLAAEADKTTVHGSLQSWLETLDVRPRTLRDYRGEVRVIEKGLVGLIHGEASWDPEEETGPSILVEAVTLNLLEDLFHKAWQRLSGGTKRKRLKIMRLWFLHLVSHRLLRENPLAGFKAPKKWRDEAKKGTKPKYSLTPEEAKKLLQACKAARVIGISGAEKTKAERMTCIWWAAFIGLKSGLRISNILGNADKPGLSWQNVDLAGGKFTLVYDEQRRQPMKGPGISIPGRYMKTGEDFVVPLDEELAEELRKLRASLGRIPADDEPIIPGSKYKHDFEAAIRRAGLPALGWHSLRRTYARWLAKTSPFVVVQFCLHHAAETTTETYIDIDEETIRNALATLPKLLTNEHVLDKKSVGV